MIIVHEVMSLEGGTAVTVEFGQTDENERATLERQWRSAFIVQLVYWLYTV